MSVLLQKYKYFLISEVGPGVAHVEINRPDKLNSFFEPMWHELRDVFDSCSTDPDIRVIVLSGSGEKAFTSGLDLNTAQGGTVFGAPKDCLTAVERCEKPVVCVLHGYAFGLAVDLATCTDVRFCTEDVQFAVKEVDIGLAADVGTLTRLPKVIGNYSWVKDVCLSTRVFRAAEAREVGLVSAVFKDKSTAVAKAIEWALLVASKSPVAVQGTKELLNWSREHNVSDGLRYTGVWNGAALQTKDIPMAIQATIQKKKPKFEKL